MSFLRAVILFWASFLTMLVLTPHERIESDIPITVGIAFVASALWALFAVVP